MYSTLWILAKHLETTTATDGILLKQQYDYTGYILLFDKWFPLQDENSQELWFMHAWSETKEREMLTFTGNIKGQRSNCALQANCLPVPAICPYNRDEILIFCHFFPLCSFSRNMERLNDSVRRSPHRNYILKKTGTNEAMVTEMFPAKFYSI